MNAMEMSASLERDKFVDTSNKNLRESVKESLEKYFAHLEGHKPANLYELVLEEIEIPLLEVVMRYVRNNQCKAAILLGISRGTLRKKLKQYNLEKNKN